MHRSTDVPEDQAANASLSLYLLIGVSRYNDADRCGSVGWHLLYLAAARLTSSAAEDKIHEILMRE